MLLACCCPPHVVLPGSGHLLEQARHPASSSN
jgi:hypothetical protein